VRDYFDATTTVIGLPLKVRLGGAYAEVIGDAALAGEVECSRSAILSPTTMHGWARQSGSPAPPLRARPRSMQRWSELAARAGSTRKQSSRLLCGSWFRRSFTVCLRSMCLAQHDGLKLLNSQSVCVARMSKAIQWLRRVDVARLPDRSHLVRSKHA